MFFQNAVFMYHWGHLDRWVAMEIWNIVLVFVSNIGNPDVGYLELYELIINTFALLKEY